MRVISADKITETVSALCIRANTILRRDVLAQLKLAHKKETNKRARKILGAIIENAWVAKREKLAICQDTGLPVVFLEIGQEVRIRGDLNSAVNKGVESGYKKMFLRKSIISHPLSRGKSGYFPAVIHTETVKGNKLKITFFPKGFGCENKTQLKMFNPTAGIKEIKKFIIHTVKSAGADACPPYIVGVGIGGTADYAMFLAKRALLRAVNSQQSTVKRLEAELLKEINKLNIGPMGLGGKTTCLGVNIEIYPTHIAGLPVAVNISCHALRSATITL